jgi:hypothetical protein
VNNKSPYPRYFKTPEGRPVSIRKMGIALKTIREAPDKEYPGWDWFPVPGHYILRSFRDGLNHRINMRAAQ